MEISYQQTYGGKMKRTLFLSIALYLTACVQANTLNGSAQQTGVAATVASVQQTAVSATLTQMAFELAQTELAEVPIKTTMPSLTPPTGTYQPSDSLSPSGAYDGWQKYENTFYGFSFYYPPGWTVTQIVNMHTDQVNPNSICVQPPTGTAVLHVSFRSVDEAIQIAPTGMGSGEMIERGTVIFMGEAVTRNVLVAQGIDVSVNYFGSGIELTRAGLVFVLSCSDPNGWTPGQPGLSPDLEQTVDWIVSSFSIP
jgi:hypothetical protein